MSKSKHTLTHKIKIIKLEMKLTNKINRFLNEKKKENDCEENTTFFSKAYKI